MATVGLALIAAAVNDLADARHARIAMWILAFEPTNVFFSGIIHKEAPLYLAEGLAVYGCAQVWVRGRTAGLAPAIAGCLIAVACRPYAGWFLSVGVGLTIFHAALRPAWRNTRRGRLVVFALIAVTVVSAPAIWNASSKKQLQRLQFSQQVNATDNSNLKLEAVNFSNRSEIITNLPTRLFDIAFKPYPWQLGNTSQRVGLLGTVVVLATLAALGLAVVRRPSKLLSRAGPLVYVGGAVLCGYALSAGNAGTAFRYRTHATAIAIALALVWLARARGTAPAEAAAPAGWTQGQVARGQLAG
jgi:hypothetical protein